MRRNEQGSVDLLTVGMVAGVLFVLALIATPIIYTVSAYHNNRTVTCTVEDKDRAGDDGEMRVYTKECGNLKVEDALWAGNFHSSDTYREIEVGKTYRFEVNGYRVPFFSEFPNILSVDPA